MVLSSRMMIVLVTLLVALGPLSTDMYLPSLPAMMEFFSVEVEQVQLTLSSFLVGFALSQLIYGPLADRFGRKPVIAAGMLLFALASLGCAFAESIEALIVWRFLQALGGCAGPVLGRAMIRDLYSPLESARLLSFVASAMSLAPAIGPLLGGYLVIWFDWQAIFVLLMLYGLALSLIFALKVPETLPQENRQPFRLKPTLANYRTLLTHPSYMGYVFSCAFAYSGLFAFISGSSFVVIDYFQVPEQYFGYFFLVAIVGYITGSFLAGRYSRRLGLNVLMKLGLAAVLLSGMVIASVVMLEWYKVLPVFVPIYFFCCGVGVIMPQSMAGALAPFAHMAGTASALFGFLQMSCAAVVGIWVGHSYDSSPAGMLSAIALMGLLAPCAYFLLIERRAEQAG